MSSPQHLTPVPVQTPAWLDISQCHVADLAHIVQATPTQRDNCPLAASILQDVPVYDCAGLRSVPRQALMTEWASVWADGPGVLVLQGLFKDLAVVDAATVLFQTLIAEGRLSGKWW